MEDLKFMVTHIKGEIEIGLLDNIIKALPEIDAIYSPEFTLLIHGMGSQTRSFYSKLKHDKAIEVIWSGWCSKTWWTYLFSFIPGQAGLIKIIDREKVDSLYFEIGAQSMCGLYFVPNAMVEKIIGKVKDERVGDISDLLIQEDYYFTIVVDFDYRSENRNEELYYREFTIGEKVDEAIKKLLQ